MKFSPQSFLIQDGSKQTTYPSVAAKINVGKVPRWFIRAIRNAYQDCKIRRFYERLDFQVPLFNDGIGRSILDHWGTLKFEDGTTAFVMEPYDLDKEDMRALIRVSDKLKIDFTVSATSFHYPTRTMRIIFFQK